MAIRVDRRLQPDFLISLPTILHLEYLSGWFWEIIQIISGTVFFRKGEDLVATGKCFAHLSSLYMSAKSMHLPMKTDIYKRDEQSRGLTAQVMIC